MCSGPAAVTPSQPFGAEMSSQKKTMISEALKLARLYWGYSQVELAEATGISQAMISDIERGTKAVTLETLDRYSEALGVRKSDLMFFAEEIEGHPPITKGRLIFAEAAIRILERLKPKEPGRAENS